MGATGPQGQPVQKTRLYPETGQSDFYCRVPTKTCPLAGMAGNIGWTPGVVRRDLENLRMYNQIVRMKSDSMSRRVLSYDREKAGSWSLNLKSICGSIGKNR